MIYFLYPLQSILNLNPCCLDPLEIGRAHLSVQPVQSVPITTKVVSSYPVHGEVYSIQHYVVENGIKHHNPHLNHINSLVQNVNLEHSVFIKSSIMFTILT
jgi:hypothetical protein